MDTGNLFAGVPHPRQEEVSETLLEGPHFRLERIVSTGHETPEGQWYDQERNEWVAVLSGSAGVLFEGETEVREMRPGDHVLIPAHRRHRVAWTDPHQQTVWLAIHY
jgi:cupin 2 domain-containing protein